MNNLDKIRKLLFAACIVSLASCAPSTPSSPTETQSDKQEVDTRDEKLKKVEEAAKKETDQAIRKLAATLVNDNEPRDERIKSGEEILLLNPQHPKKEAIKNLLNQLKSQGDWKYYTFESDFDGTKYRSASVDSNNEIELGFPYQGPQKATIHISSPVGGAPSASISVERGQWDCGSECFMRAIFDDGEPVVLYGKRYRSSGHPVVHLNDQFYQQLKNSETIKIQATFFRQGSHTFSFNLSGLNVDHIESNEEPAP